MTTTWTLPCWALAPSLCAVTPSGEHSCSDAVAARLHWLDLVIDQLEGTDNAYGFLTGSGDRTALDGQAPLDFLQCPWNPDDEAILFIVALTQLASLGMQTS